MNEDVRRLLTMVSHMDVGKVYLDLSGGMDDRGNLDPKQVRATAWTFADTAAAFHQYADKIDPPDIVNGTVP